MVEVREDGNTYVDLLDDEADIDDATVRMIARRAGVSDETVRTILAVLRGDTPIAVGRYPGSL